MNKSKSGCSCVSTYLSETQAQKISMAMAGDCNIIPDKGESKDAHRGKSDTAQQERDQDDDESHLVQPQHFMESMIQQYTSLVEDLSRELLECQEYIKLYIDSEPEKVCKRGNDGVDGEEDVVVSLKEQVRRKDALIVNLQRQLEISQKTSNVNKSLWQSCISNIETLETQKSQMEIALTTATRRRQSRSQQKASEVGETRCVSGNACQHVSSLPSDFLSKWKLLQTYSESLENRLAKSASERNFYRSKMLDVRLEYETALKRQAVEKSREVEHVKASYSKEIEYLKACVDKLREHNKASWEKRLEAEKETWEYREHKRLQSLKIHVENLIMENELLRQKQLQFDSIIRSMNISNDGGGSSWLGGSQQYQGSCVDVAHAQVQCNFVSDDKRYKSVQTEMNGAIVSADQVNRMKTSQHQLELEYKRILVQLDFTEATAQTKTSNLEERIQQLESLNAHLHDQIMGLNEANAKLVSHKTADDSKRLVDSQVPRAQQMPQIPLISPVLIEQPSWSKPDDFLVHEKYRVDSSMWKLKLSRMEEEMQRLESEKEQLLSVVEEQQNIVNKWKAEVKGLVNRGIQLVRR